MARKLIRSRNVLFLEDQIVSSDIEKSNESHTSPEIHIIQTSISTPIVHNDYGGAGEDNNDGTIESVDQAPLELLAPPIEPELRKSTREQ